MDVRKKAQDFDAVKLQLTLVKRFWLHVDNVKTLCLVLQVILDIFSIKLQNLNQVLLMSKHNHKKV